MKNLVLISALAAGLAALAPSNADAARLSAGMVFGNGYADGYLTLTDHRRDRRGRYCDSWHRAHRRLHRRYDRVRLRRTVYNRRGDKIYIAHVRNHHGRPYRVRYNACTRRIRASSLGHRHHRRGYRCESWRYAHRKLHRRYDHVRLLRRRHNRRGDRIFIARVHNHRGRAFRVRYNACLGRVVRTKPLNHHRRHHRRYRP